MVKFCCKFRLSFQSSCTSFHTIFFSQYNDFGIPDISEVCAAMSKEVTNKFHISPGISVIKLDLL